MIKYKEIAKKIEEYIQINQLTQGEKLPSLIDLSEEYQVSKNTIVKSLSILEEKGMIYQVQGSGIFVRRQHKKGYLTLSQQKGFSEDLQYLEEKSEVLELKLLPANEEIASNLMCDIGQDVYYIKRLHYIRGQIFCVEQSYYNATIIPILNKKIAEKSIFSYIDDEFNIEVGFSDKYIKVVKGKENVMKLLQLPEGYPVLVLEELHYSKAGIPFDYSKNSYHYEHSQFFLQG